MSRHRTPLISIAVLVACALVGWWTRAETRPLELPSDLPVAGACPAVFSNAEGPFRHPGVNSDSLGQELQVATFSMGCFWGVEATFGGLPGVVRTRVGYAGGTTEEPHYGAIGDHAEAVEVEFDPEQVSYPELLEVFFEHHNPRLKPVLRQYSNAVFVHDAEQKRQALAAWKRHGGGLTAVIEAGRFHPAEDYHQKYYLRQIEVVAQAFKGKEDLVSSPLAAKVNAYIAGRGDEAQLLRTAEAHHLDQESTATLLGLFRQMRG